MYVGQIKLRFNLIHISMFAWTIPRTIDLFIHIMREEFGYVVKDCIVTALFGVCSIQNHTPADV